MPVVQLQLKLEITVLRLKLGFHSNSIKWCDHKFSFSRFLFLTLKYMTKVMVYRPSLGLHHR